MWYYKRNKSKRCSKNLSSTIYASKWHQNSQNIPVCQIIISRKRRKLLPKCQSVFLNTNRKMSYNVSFNKLGEKILILYRERPTSSSNVWSSMNSSRRENLTSKMSKIQQSNTLRNAKSTIHYFCQSLRKYTKRHFAFKTIKSVMVNAKESSKHVRS